jgi:hypothetical protein
MNLINKNKDNIEEGDYEKMCSILKYLHMKDISRQYIIKYYKISYENIFNKDTTDTHQLLKIKTKIVIIENPRILEYLEKIASSTNDIDEINLKFDKRDNNVVYLDIENRQHSSYHIISNDNDEEDEDKYGIKFNKILIINYKKYEACEADI